MGIHDRKYMNNNQYGRQSPFGGGLPKTFTVKFVIIAAVLYFVDALLNGQLIGSQVVPGQLAFHSGLIKDNWEFWRIFTAFFLVSPGETFLSVVITLIVFYWVGNHIEREIGAKRYVNLLITTSLGMALIGPILPATGTITVGDRTFPLNEPFGYIRGMLSGLFLAYGLFLGKQKMTLLLFFVLPLTLTGYALIGFTVGIIFITALFFHSATALPMLGGCFGSYLFISQFMKGTHIDYLKFFKPKNKKNRTQQKPKKRGRMNTHQLGFEVINEGEDDIEDVDKYIKEVVDPILEKIATSGMNSLSAKEKKILENAKKKMGK